MANYRSIPNKYRKSVSVVDEQRLTNTLQTLDSKRNTNISKTYSAIQQVASIDLLRESDQEHLHKNLKSVIDMIDDTTIDFSKGNVGGQLQGYIASAIDGQTLKHAGIAAKYKNFEAGLAKKQEKNDGTYNQGNHQDALQQAGFYDYMKNESDSVKSFNYTNYVDVNDKMLKNIKQMKDLRPDETVEFLNPSTGQYTKKKISTLNKTEWQRVIQNSFDDNDKAQLAINGRQAYGYDDQLAVADLEKRRGDLSSKYDSEIDSLKAMKVSSVSDTQKKAYQERIDYLTKEKNASLTTLDTGAKTAGQIGSFLTQRHMSLDMANMMSKETILSNKIDYKYLNEKAKYLETSQKAKDKANNVNQGITTKATPVDLQGLDVKSKFEEQKSASATKTRGLLKNTYDLLKKQKYNDSTVADQIDILENQIVKEYTEKFGKGPSEFELHRLVVDKADHLLDASTKYQLNQSLLETEQFFNAEKEAKKKTIDNILTSNSQDFFEQTFDDERQMVMFDKEGNKTTYGKFLRENGVTDKASFDNFLNSDTDKAKLYKANVVFQSLPLNQKRGGRGLLTNANPIGLTGAAARLLADYDFEGTEALKYEYAQQVFGDNINNIFELTADEEYKGIQMYNQDRTIRNEGAVNSLLENDNYEKEYDKVLNLESATIPGMNTLTISTESPLHGELLAATSNAGFKPKVSISLIDNGDTITMYQEDSVQKTKFNMAGEQSTGQEIEYITETINKNDLSPTNYPELYEQLQDQQEKADINFFGQAGYEKEDLHFYEDSANQAQGLIDLFGNNQSLIQQASKSTASPYIKNTLRSKLTGKQGANQFYQIVDKSIEQSDKFNVSLSTSTSGGYSQVQIKMKTKNWTEQNPDYEVLYTQPVDTSSEELNKILHGAPQLMLTTLLMQAGNQVGQNNVTLANKIAKNLD